MIEDDAFITGRPFSDFLPDSYTLSHRSLGELRGLVSNVRSDFRSMLIERVEEAERTPMDELRCEQVRVLVGQKFDLEWLARPVAIFVTHHPRANIEFYPGDLTLAALRASKEFFGFAPVETRQMLAQDYSWFAQEYVFDSGQLLKEATGALHQARALAGRD